jgi:hypothetical protein
MAVERGAEKGMTWKGRLSAMGIGHMVSPSVAGSSRIKTSVAAGCTVNHTLPSVADGIAHAQEDRLILSFCFCKGFVAPRVPIHGIIGALEQIRQLKLVHFSFLYGRFEVVHAN